MRKIIYKISAIAILFVICSCYSCYAAVTDKIEITIEDGGGSSSTESENTSTGDAGKGLPNLGGVANPLNRVSLGDTTLKIINTVLGAIMAIGTVLITVLIAVTGFETIMGSADEKAFAKEKMMGYLIAAVLVTSGASIAKFIISAM